MARTAPAPKPLATLAEVKALLRVREGTTEHDQRIQLLLNTASSQITTALRRQLAGGQYVDLFRTVGSGRARYDWRGSTNESGQVYDVRRQRFVLTALTVDPAQPFEVRYDPRGVFGDDTVVNPELYTLEPEDGVLWLEAITQDALAALRVTYAGGWPEDDAGTLSVALGADMRFAPLRLACITQTVHLFSRLVPDNIGVDADRGAGTVPTGRFTTRGGLCSEAQALVAPFVQPLVGRG